MFIFIFFLTGSLGCWWNPLQTGKEVFFILQVFQYLSVLKISNEGASSRDPKDRSEYQSRGEKHQRDLEDKEESIQRYVGAFRSTNDGNKPSNEFKVAIV